MWWMMWWGVGATRSAGVAPAQADYSNGLWKRVAHPTYNKINTLEQYYVYKYNMYDE